MNPEETQLESAMQERFKQLPKVVQDAITSADVEQHLRTLADNHKLHLDQWATLENEVMLALLGFQPVTDLVKNIEKEVGVDSATAVALASDISTVVFTPIRGELERLLDHPAAEATATSGVEDVRTQILSQREAAPMPVVQAATPPPTAPIQKVERTPLSGTYAPSIASHERKTVEGDPYREQVL